MRGADTNVLLRVVLLDDPVQARVVERLLEQLSARAEPLYVTSVVLCEFVWGLERTYKRTRTEIANTLKQLLESDLVIAEYPDESQKAADLYRRGPGDYADYLIGLIHQSGGCRDTVTFDRALRSVPGFTLLE